MRILGAILLISMWARGQSDIRITDFAEIATSELDAGDLDAAERDAFWLLQVADTNAKEWNHDDMIHAANTVLGRVAIARGDLKEAKSRLLASAKVKGSPVLSSFGPGMNLAQELLAAGERDAVLQYLDLCRGFWKNDRGRLDRYMALIRGQATPNLLAPYTSPETSIVGTKAPSFRLTDLSGKLWTLDQFRGKPLVIDFWASWCHPCLEQLTALEKLANEFPGIAALAIDVGESESTVRRFAAQHRIALPVLLAGEDAMILDYHVEAYPTLVVIDSTGSVARNLIGAESEPELRETLRGLSRN